MSLYERQTPISNYSVVRSLATPSRLLLCPKCGLCILGCSERSSNKCFSSIAVAARRRRDKRIRCGRGEEKFSARCAAPVDAKRIFLQPIATQESSLADRKLLRRASRGSWSGYRIPYAYDRTDLSFHGIHSRCSLPRQFRDTLFISQSVLS